MPPIQDDQELVDAALGGDGEAVDRLLRMHYDHLYALCRRLAGNDADAADATQEALIAIARGLATGRFEGRSRFSTWAFRVATNSALDELRRRRRRPEPVSQDRLGEARGLDEEAVAGRVDVDAALQQLPPEFRAAVVLRDLCQLDYATVADVLGVPIGTVRSRIARGRAALVPLLGNQTTSPTRPTSSP